MSKNLIERGEEGQSLIIIGALLVVLVALIGLVVDAGNAYAQRRIVQNAVDAASIAGAQQLGHQDDWKIDPYNPDLYLYNYQVIDAVESFVERNGVNPEDISIYYADIDGNILADAKFDLAREDIIDEYAFGGPRAEAIIVEADHNFPTYLVRVVGRNSMTASANAAGILACGACTAGDPITGGLFPIAVYQGTFDHTDWRVDFGTSYRIWGKDAHFPGTGSFGYLSWNDDPGHTSEPTLVSNMADTTRSGLWAVGDMIPTGPGVKASNSVEQELRYRIDDRDDLGRPREVTLPIFDYTEGTGENLRYHIVGFGRFEIECYHFSKNRAYSGKNPDGSDICTFDRHDNEKWIQGKFKPYTQATGTSGCTDFGICTAIPAELEIKRALAGRVIPWRVYVQQDATLGEPQPVDLVHVIDISGSMCDEWDGTDRSSPCTSGGRLQVAKDVLTGFNTGLTTFDPGETVLDHQIGLATYPTKQSTSTYYTDCGNALGSQCQLNQQADCYYRSRTLYFATKDMNLTTDIDAVNAEINSLVADGGTSMPLGLQYGREMVTDPLYRNPDHLQVLILTSDGMPNIKLDGEWTGYRGKYPNPPLIVESGCNDSVRQAAIEQANLAKEAGVVVFTIGIHETIDEALMRAIASPDTHPDKPHFFQARTGEEFEEIYRSIEDRLPRLGTEECIANENAAVGAGAWVYLYDDQGNQVASTQASSTGDFIFDNIEPGTYELRASWVDNSMNPSVLYDVMTWTLGGDPANGPITVDVPLGEQTTQINLYLRTSEQFTCP